MKGIREDAIAKISWGVLFTMGSGLVALTVFLVRISYQAEAQAKAVEKLQQDAAILSTIQTDIAVIKNDVRRLLEDRRHRAR